MSNSVPVPAELCGCPVDSALSASAFLAIGPGGRGVVLKRMDAQCIVRGLLHPSIRDRLTRVRELAHAGVANLHGAGREGEDAYLIWEFVEGTDFESYATHENRTPRQLAIAARELVLAIDALHQRGIVHGQISSANVIVSPAGNLRLTQISPMLYDDPAVDRAAALNLLGHVIEQRGESETPLGDVVRDAIERQASLRELGARVAAVLEARPVEARDDDDELSLRGPRRRNLYGAALVAMAGLLIAFGILATQSRGQSWAQTLHLPSNLPSLGASR